MLSHTLLSHHAPENVQDLCLRLVLPLTTREFQLELHIGTLQLHWYFQSFWATIPFKASARQKTKGKK